MTSPIGRFLTEFRPANAPHPVSVPADGDFADFGANDQFDDAVESLFPANDTGALDSLAPLAADTPPEVPTGPSVEDLTAALEAMRADHAAALAEARQHWTESEGAVLARHITQSFDVLEQRIADTLAPLLEPFLVKGAQLKALEQIHDAIRTLVSGGDERPVTVRGPEDLIEAIRTSYAGPIALAFQAGADPDVTVTMGDTRIRSQLRVWARKLDGALGAQR